jgi:hypothetical protein
VRVSACGEMDRPAGVSDCPVNWCNGRGELVCRTGVGNGRWWLEVDIELIWSDVTL